MAKKRVYCVQSYWQDRRKLAQGELLQFERQAQALSRARRIARRAAGVLVYAVDCDVEIEWWGEPQFIAAEGEVPRLEFTSPSPSPLLLAPTEERRPARSKL